MEFAFLIYASRSGSTLLARHLDGISDEVLVIPEFRLTDMLMMRAEHRITRLSPAELLKLFRLDYQIANLGLAQEELEMVARECAGKGSRALIEALVARHAARRARRPSLVIIKNNFNGFLLRVHERLRDVFPEAAFIHIYRDGRGVVNSLIHTKSSFDPARPMGRGDVLFCARHWCRYLEKVERLVREPGAAVIPVRYEDFVAAPTEVLAAIAASLSRHFGVALAAGGTRSTFKVPERERALHGLVEKEPMPARSEGWKTELKPWEGIAVERIQRESLARYGYGPYFLAGLSRGAKRRALARTQAVHLWLTVAHYLRRLRQIAWLSLVDRTAARAQIFHAINRLIART